MKPSVHDGRNKSLHAKGTRVLYNEVRMIKTEHR